MQLECVSRYTLRSKDRSQNYVSKAFHHIKLYLLETLHTYCMYFVSVS